MTSQEDTHSSTTLTQARYTIFLDIQKWNIGPMIWKK